MGRFHKWHSAIWNIFIFSLTLQKKKKKKTHAAEGASNNDLLHELMASLVAQMVKNLPAMQETRVQSLGCEDPLEKGVATHSGILA